MLEDRHDTGSAAGATLATEMGRPAAPTPASPGHRRLRTWLDTLASRARQPVGVVLPDGTRLVGGEGTPSFAVVFRTRRALAATLVRGHMGLLEAWFDQAVDVEGDLHAAFAAGLCAGFDHLPLPWLHVENAWHEWRHGNGDSSHAQSNARAHYGLGIDFYRHFLDREGLLYTCAYWAEGVRTLEEAQAAKVDHVCRKLMLGPADRFVDIGCGFGGFLLRAQATTGARGVGVNTTPEQVAWLRGEIDRRGQSGSLQVVQGDFREGLPGAPFDKLASIGVLEHAGRDQLDDVIGAHARALRPGGLGVLHFIGHQGPQETELFIRKHVFPGGWIPALSDVLVAMERHGLDLIDVENLRRHYALTLDEWDARFEASWERIRALDPARFDERFHRTWRGYLVGCAELFRSPAGQTHLFQVVFSKGRDDAGTWPMTRDFLHVRR